MNAMLEPAVEMMPMNTQDIDEILKIEYRAYPFPWSRANFTDSLSAGYSCWVCRIGGELIGYFVVMLAVDEAHLLNISVAERHQRRGYGARLLRQAMGVATLAGARILLLEVRPSNEKAIALYKHFGFAEISRRKAYYPADGGREDALVMTHPLQESLA